MDDDRPTPTDLRVLAIDDEPFQLKLLSKQLAGLGIDQVRTCLEAAVALAQLQADYAMRGVNLVRVATKWTFRTAGDLAGLAEMMTEDAAHTESPKAASAPGTLAAAS